MTCPDAPSVFIVRHSQSEFNAEGRWAGWTDTHLTPRGRLEAAKAAGRMSNVPFRAVITSDLSRAATGGRIIAEILGLKLLPVDARLRERNAGEWQGRIVAELADDPAYVSWREHPKGGIPGGEDFDVFVNRLVAGVTAAAAEAAALSGHVLVVCHDGVLQALDEYFEVGRYPYGVLDGFWVPNSRLNT